MKRSEIEATAWDRWSQFSGQLPGVQAASKGIKRAMIQRLCGFWLLWHVFGGLEGLIQSGMLTKSTAYRQKVEFAAVFGVEVEDFAPEAAAAVARFGVQGRQDEEQGE